MPRRKKRDTYLYRLKKGRETVYIGITKKPKQRKSEHKRSKKRFTGVKLSFPSSVSTALKKEKKALKTYKRNHGHLPRYNKRG